MLGCKIPKRLCTPKQWKPFKSPKSKFYFGGSVLQDKTRIDRIDGSVLQDKSRIDHTDAEIENLCEKINSNTEKASYMRYLRAMTNKKNAKKFPDLVEAWEAHERHDMNEIHHQGIW